MQRMSRGQDQWQLNAHETWLAQKRHETQQWWREPSIVYALLDACELEISCFFFFLKIFLFFLKKFQMKNFDTFHQEGPSHGVHC